MLQIVQTEPYVLGNVWYQDSWALTADAIFVTWPTDGVGYIDCYGRMYTINNAEDLEAACGTIASSSDFEMRG
jgi:hypothetical protein